MLAYVLNFSIIKRKSVFLHIKHLSFLEREPVFIFNVYKNRLDYRKFNANTLFEYPWSMKDKAKFIGALNWNVK